MTELNTQPNLTDPDAFYEALVQAHEGLTPDQSAALNARLILILANQVGNLDVLTQAIKLATEA